MFDPDPFLEYVTLCHASEGGSLILKLAAMLSTLAHSATSPVLNTYACVSLILSLSTLATSPERLNVTVLNCDSDYRRAYLHVEHTQSRENGSSRLTHAR